MVKVASIKNIIKGLKPGQQKTMRRHAKHHSLKHMRSMALAMKKGATFQSAHRRAMRSLGKWKEEEYKKTRKQKYLKSILLVYQVEEGPEEQNL